MAKMKIKIVNCLYCGALVNPPARLDREGVCKQCRNIDDEESDDDEERVGTCEFCGCDIYEDDGSWTTDEILGCSDCVRYCAYCDGYHNRDDVRYCEDCDQETCEEFVECACGSSVCRTCANDNWQECDECGEMFCENCILRCEKCFSFYCKDCLEEGLCSACKKELEEEKDAEEKNGNKTKTKKNQTDKNK